jgi:hypothetical protein
MSDLRIDTATAFYLGATERRSVHDRSRSADLAVVLPADSTTAGQAPSSFSAAAFVDESTATALVFSRMRADVQLSQSLVRHAVEAYAAALEHSGETGRSSSAAQLAADVATAETVALQPLLASLLK